VLDLGSSTPLLDKMYLWNVQENAPGGWENRGINGFNVHYATSPTVTPPATSGTATPYDFSSGGWTSLGGFNLAIGTGNGDAGESFDLSGAAGAQFIGIEITSNHGGNRSGFAEVAFTTIPEPGSIALLLGGGLLGLLRRHRRW
jgi:hypothetical protein